MIIALFAATLASPLDLNLVCRSQYEKVETSVRTANHLVDGELHSDASVMRTTISRAGVARVTFQGGAGELTYPDGRRRILGGIAADPRRITADYRRKGLFGPVTWRIEINRMTGDLRVSSGEDVAFAGACAPEPISAKF